MRPLWLILLIAPVVALVVYLNRFSHEEVDRVELHAEGAAPLLLLPGTSASAPWNVGRSVVVAAYIGKAQVCEGAVVDVGMGLTYRQRSQAKNIEVEHRSGQALDLQLTNVDLKTGNVARQVFLRLERRGDMLVCEFPKPPAR